jgi:endo-1,4-beta-mannosidase
LPYRFVGLDTYAAVQAPCWWREDLNRALTAIGQGQDVGRVFAFQRTATTNGVRDWTYMDAMLATFHAHNQRVIMVLTDQWHGQPCSDVRADRTLSWYQSGYKTTLEQATTYRNWVTEVVTRYRNDPTVAVWQLVNEGEARNPNGSCSELAARAALRSFTDDVGGLVKRIDPNHLVSLGTVSGECGSTDADYGYINNSPSIDLCDYHDYHFDSSPMGNTDSSNGLLLSLNRCHADGKAFFVGEVGIPFKSISPGTTTKRAALLSAKLTAQFQAGSVGELLWCWSSTYSASPPRDMEITPGDPALGLLSRY